MGRDYCQRYAKRAIKHNRLVCFGGVKLAGLDRVSFDAINDCQSYMEPSRRLTIKVTYSLAPAQANPPTGHRLIVCLSQWLNYSKVGGGTLHFFPSLSFLSLPQSSHLFFLPLPSPLEVGRPPSASGSGRTL